MSKTISQNIRFNGTSFVMKGNSANYEKIKQSFLKIPDLKESAIPTFDSTNNEITIRNNNKTLISELFYISNQEHFSFVGRRLKPKYSEIENTLWQFNKVSYDFVEESFTDNEFNKLVLEQIRKNNIKSISNNEFFEIPAEFFDYFITITDEDKKISNYMKELFSLIFLSEYTQVIDDNFSFTVQNNEFDSSEKEVKWRDWESLNGTAYFNAYLWIKEKAKEKFSISVLIKVVRQVMSKSDNLFLDEESCSRYDSILNILISKQTELYFAQQNKLKDEFLNLNKAENESNNKLLSKFLGLIISLGVAIYGVLIKNVNSGKLQILHENMIIGISFLIALISTIFFSFTFFVDIVQRKNLYHKLLSFYVQKLNFSKEDFKSSVEEPKYFHGHAIQLCTMFLFIIIAIAGCLFYFGYFPQIKEIITRIVNYNL